MTTNLIVRLKDFAMWKVSISKGKTAPQEFLSGDRQRYSLPEDMPVMHFEYTQFYYPGDMEFPREYTQTSSLILFKSKLILRTCTVGQLKIFGVSIFKLQTVVWPKM